MRTKRIFAVVVALGLVAGNVWPHDIASDVDVETSAEVVAEQELQPAVADSVTMAADTVKKQNFFKRLELISSVPIISTLQKRLTLV